MKKQNAKSRRLERAKKTRESIIEVAVDLIGEHGYPGCSIARIAEATGIAQGAFYLHFDSQQALFEALVPTYAAEMFRVIGRAIRGSRSLVELEARSFRANHQFLLDHKYVHRVLVDASSFAPEGHAKFQRIANKAYIRSLSKFIDTRESHADLESVSTMLVGARWRVLVNLGSGSVRRPITRPISEDVVNAYANFASSSIRATLISL